MTRDDTPRRSGRKPVTPRRALSATPAPRALAEAAPSAKEDRGRIAKLMARVGLCSRRDAESWILDGRVSLNGAVLTSPAVDVGSDDRILVDGAPLPAFEKTRLFLFHKPAGLISSDRDPEGRETVHDYLRQHWPDGPRVVTIGRLDYNTEGLLLLTNDGGLARLLELPRTGWVRRYRARAKGETNQAVLDTLRGGVTVEGIDYAGIEATLDRMQGANCWLTIGLREGKNREVKRVLEHLGLEVNRLIRLSFGPFQLLDLPEGAVEEVKTRVLREQLGPALTEAAGADFGEREPIAAIVPPPAREVRSGGKRQREPREGKPGRGERPVREPSRRDRDEPPALQEKRERPTSGPRRHVSALRADTGQGGPRKRLERTDTTDRKNRKVTVERLVQPAPARAVRGGERRTWPSANDAASPQRERGISRSAEGKRERVARSGGAREDRPASERPPRSPSNKRPEAQVERKPRRPEGQARPDSRRDTAASRGGPSTGVARRFEEKLSYRKSGSAPAARGSGSEPARSRPPRGQGAGGKGRPESGASHDGGARATPRGRPSGGPRPPRAPRR